MTTHSDWGTPGGATYWYADRFEEDDQDRKALGRALLLGVVLAACATVAAWHGISV